MSTDMEQQTDFDAASREVCAMFAQELGLTGFRAEKKLIGNVQWLEFLVGRHAPVYDRALRRVQAKLPADHPLQGAIGTRVEKGSRFLSSVEVDILRVLLVRSTRMVVGRPVAESIATPLVPFQNNEDQKIIQPATQIVYGRRGVGKSTLVRRASELLRGTNNACVLMDMQAYAQRDDDGVFADVFADLATQIGVEIKGRSDSERFGSLVKSLEEFSQKILDEEIAIERASAALRRLVSAVTSELKTDLFVFLDDYHLIDEKLQPTLVHMIHGALKGARGWLKISGLHSFLVWYDPKTKRGLQTPGDAQLIPLDLTLVHPAKAQEHIQAILLGFLSLVGVEKLDEVVAENAFHRLVWASAGVPRDFLQMLNASIEHARNTGRSRVAITDANRAIGEFGQPKMAELEQDARNEKDLLGNVLESIQAYCLEKKHINAFLVREDNSAERQCVQRLSDLRLVHLLNTGITPDRAGERYEAYMLDYSLFTGVRRRPNVKEFVPENPEDNFKATQLRKLPKLPSDLVDLLSS